MSKKVASPSAVFAACEALDEQKASWNRDDVRHHIGGGSFTVIDPLIQAWRKLKPIKAIAPTTPTQLLHDIAQSLEAHLATYTQDIQKRDAQRAQTFDTASQTLNERIVDLESQLSEQIHRHHVLANEETELTKEKERLNQVVNKQEHQLAQKQIAIDELNGAHLRVEKALSEAKENYANELRLLENKHKNHIEQLKLDYQQQLKQQKEDLMFSNEKSEDRLMKIIDQERTEAKLAKKAGAQQLDQARKRELEFNEKSLAMASKINQLEHALAQLKQDNKGLLEDQAAEKSQREKIEQQLHAAQQRAQGLGFAEIMDTITAMKEKIDSYDRQTRE